MIGTPTPYEKRLIRFYADNITTKSKAELKKIDIESVVQKNLNINLPDKTELDNRTHNLLEKSKIEIDFKKLIDTESLLKLTPTYIKWNEEPFYKILLTCIPFIGIVCSFIYERSLRKAIGETAISSAHVQLIERKNKYKLCSIIRALLTFTLAAVTAAIKGLTRRIRIVAIVSTGMIAGSCIVFYAYGRYKNRQLVKDLEEQREIDLNQLQ